MTVCIKSNHTAIFQRHTGKAPRTPAALAKHGAGEARPTVRYLATAACIGLLTLSAPAEAGDAQSYDRIIVFGDSISDGGNYSAKAPAGAGSFTTNPDPVWVEVIASELGLGLTPHAVDGGTNYAEGGARVAKERSDAPGDLSRRPVVAQVNDFLGSGDSFDRNSLVIIQGGGNDVFSTHLNGPSYTPADLQVLDEAALALTQQVERIAAAGAGTIVTTSVPKFEVFNERYEAALAASGVNVLYFDKAALIAEIEANPGEFGIVNTTDRACKGRALESFVCLPEDYVVPDANETYLYADNVHFTGVVHRMEGQAVVAMLLAAGQVSQLPYIAHSALQNEHRWLDTQLASTTPKAGSWSVIGNIGYESASVDSSDQHLGMESDGYGMSLGAVRAFGSGVALGALLSWRELDGEFGQDSGEFNGHLLSLTGFGRARLGQFDLALDAAYGDIAFEDIARRIVLGPSVRTESGNTSGQIISLQGQVGWAPTSGEFQAKPVAALRYDFVELDAYEELGGRSTQIAFGKQSVETLVGSFGAELSWSSEASPLRPFAEGRYNVDLLDNGRSITLTPSGASVPYRTAAYTPDSEYFSYAAGIEARLSPAVSAALTAAGTFGHGDLDTKSLRLSLRSAF